MQRCPLNSFEECIGEACPLYNRALKTCLLPRVLLSIIHNKENKTELKGELNYEQSKQH